MAPVRAFTDPIPLRGFTAAAVLLALAAPPRGVPSGLAAQEGPTVVQPGAPGEPTRTLDRAELRSLERPGYAPADVAFIRGMIPHHRQALEMVDLLRERSGDESLRRIGLRIEISQEDEIALMRRWLEERGEPLPADSAGAHHLRSPGMLTPAQMQRLARARGETFDRLFLELMIRHHEGALAMVRELLASPGAAQGSAIYQIASEVQSDQEMEIERMRGLLEDL